MHEKVTVLPIAIDNEDGDTVGGTIRMREMEKTKLNMYMLMQGDINDSG